jgi:hypothetical protein
LNVDIDHIGERSMTQTLSRTAAAFAAYVLVNALWLATLAPHIA